MEDTLLSREAAGVLHLTINRPNEKNALNRSLVRLLHDEINRASTDPAIRVILLSGAGEAAFCAGADLQELAALSSTAERRDFFGAIGALIGAFTSCAKPIIAKVRGYALAGGCGLVAASDIVVASEDSLFGLPEIQLGIAPLMILAPLSRCIGHKALADLVLTGQRIGAERALALGLVSRVAPSEAIDSVVEEIVTRIAGFSPQAVSVAKKTLWTARDQELFNSLEILADRIGILASSEEALEGISAFLEKRSPSWKR
jgi:enoyl-CoA hydratase/carnithine racemase